MTDKGFRDAIHVPFIMVTCYVKLEPGQKVSLRNDNECVPWTGKLDVTIWHGVADPFREQPIEPGELFSIYLRPECIKKPISAEAVRQAIHMIRGVHEAIDGARLMKCHEGVSLADWLERWEQDYADGQTTISRAEAIRRWEKERQADEVQEES